jgi:hypothetical protein
MLKFKKIVFTLMGNSNYRVFLESQCLVKIDIISVVNPSRSISSNVEGFTYLIMY